MSKIQSLPLRPSRKCICPIDHILQIVSLRGSRPQLQAGRERWPGKRGQGGPRPVPTYVAEFPVPAILADALPWFLTQSIDAARGGYALVTQRALPARLAPV